MVQRLLQILHLLWAVLLAMVDGLTLWLDLLTKQYRETSAVLCNERYLSVHKTQQVSQPPLTPHPTPHPWLCSFRQHHAPAESTNGGASRDSEVLLGEAEAKGGRCLSHTRSTPCWPTTDPSKWSRV